MAMPTLLRLIQILLAFWFVAGVVGRGVRMAQAARAREMPMVLAPVVLAGRFESLMVEPGTLAVVAFGLLTAGAQGWPIQGFLQGGTSNWVLVSLLLTLSMVPVVFWVMIPRGRSTKLCNRRCEWAHGLQSWSGRSTTARSHRRRRRGPPWL
jgi:hypothetical protein